MTKQLLRCTLPDTSLRTPCLKCFPKRMKMQHAPRCIMTLDTRTPHIRLKRIIRRKTLKHLQTLTRSINKHPMLNDRFG